MPMEETTSPQKNLNKNLSTKTVSNVIDRCKPKKIEGLKASRMFEKIDEDKHATNVALCGSQLEIESSVPDPEKQRLHSANFCRNRMCPMCAWRKSRRAGVDAMKIVNELLIRKSSFCFIFLTLTIPNVEKNLGDSIDEMLGNAWRKLRNRKAFKESIEGYMRAFEITVNESQQSFHPHMHVLLVVDSDYFYSDKYLNHDFWLRTWNDVMGRDDIKFVNIKTANAADQQEQSSMICEMAKYMTKFNDLYDIEDEDFKMRAFKEIYTGTRGRRFFEYGGILRQIQRELNIKNPDDLSSEELVDEFDIFDEGEETIITKYYWNFRRKTYVAVEKTEIELIDDWDIPEKPPPQFQFCHEKPRIILG